ncbi:DUF2007 domain-containing protein [Elizabethkingia miricola]|nr:DUF2007 domain-containing protein [Elizabethkingia miricola]
MRIYQSNILFQVEIVKGKLAANGIESFVKNEFVNNLSVMPINQDYILYVAEEDAAEAERIINETRDTET